MKKITKPKLAIVDLTDCEGCQAEIFGLKYHLPKLWQKFDIKYWRMAQNKSDLTDIDVCLIEGTPISKEDRDRIVILREKASLIGTLGSCADLGGINAILSGKKRDWAFKRIYQKNKPIKREVKPVSEYIDVDFRIPGCPIRPDFLAGVLSELLIGRIPKPKYYPVCFECKQSGNQCLLLKGKPCLGPITVGGCKAICPSKDESCLGCFGKIEGSQNLQMEKMLDKKFSKKEREQVLSIFLNNFKNNQK